MKLPIATALTEEPEQLALRVLASRKISGPLVHAILVAKDHFQIQWYPEPNQPYFLYQDPEGIYQLHLNLNLDEAHTRFVCAIAIGSLFNSPPRCIEDTLTAEEHKRNHYLNYRFALAFTISEKGLAEDCAGRNITSDFRLYLAQRYGVPQVIMDNCLVVRGYIKREDAPPLEGYFAEFIPGEFRT